MDPITLITTALAAGAAVAGKEIAAEAVRDAYHGLKTLILRKFGDQPEVPAAIQLVETQPNSEPYQQALQTSLAQAHAEADPDVVAQAQSLLDLLQQEGLGGAYLARLEGSGAIAQGPGAVAAGKGGVAIRGDVHGSVIITGDGNEVNAGGQDA